MAETVTLGTGVTETPSSNTPSTNNNSGGSTTNTKSTPSGPTSESDAEARRQNYLRLMAGISDFKNYTGRYRSVEANVDEEGNALKGTYTNLEKDYTYEGGFYYDSQLENPYLSISLHANTKLVNGEWVAWPKDLGHLESINDHEWSRCYGTYPIARSILTEDFSYSISNDFTDHNGGNQIEGIFNSIKPYAPILGKFARNGAKAADEMESESYLGSIVVEGLSSMLGKAANITKGAEKYLNKALFVQGTRFSYYNGTQFNFNNMEMRFIAFSDYVTTDGKTWDFQSVEDYIKTLQPYVMGVYNPWTADFLKDTGIQGDFKEVIKEYIGFQDPPGGFTMDTKALNNTLKGTLRLNIGGTWAIENLVLKNMNVNMSKVQAKHPKNSGETVPLYAEIVLQLAPASTLVDTGYRNILDHKGLENVRKGVTFGYKKELERLKKFYVRET